MDEFKRRRNRAFILAFLGLVGLVLVFVLKPERMVWNGAEGIVWNTEYHIKYYSSKDLTDSILGVMRRVELSVSPFNKKSRITAVNDNKTDSLDAYLIMLYEKSVEINKESNGAFDPTVSPIVNAWGFGYKNGNLPDSVQVDSMLKFVGIGKTKLDGNRLIKEDSRTTFNFSAIAKGMGSDEVGRMLQRNGVENYMVEIGGEIAVKGKNPEGLPWRVSIDKPVYSNDSIVHESAEIISVTDCGIATSGNYRNYKVDDNGRRYAHTINPVSGYPVQSDVLSATVVAPDCMTADAYATTFMVLGFARTKELLAKHGELSAYLIVATPSGIISWSTRIPKSE